MVDGLWANVSYVSGSDEVGFADQIPVPSTRPPLGTQRTTIFVGVADDFVNETQLAYWNNTDGSVGLSYRFVHTKSPEEEFLITWLQHQLEALSPPQPLVLALDFRVNPDEQSYLNVGGVYQGILWAQAQPWQVTGSGAMFHELNVFHLSICGVDLLSNYSSHWKGIVDTGASCFALPGEFFDMIMSWVPALECSEEVQTQDSWLDSPSCYLKPGYDKSALPSLTFMMEEDGPLLEIPLSLLFLPQPDGRDKICLVRAPYIREPQLLGMQVTRISFGTAALVNLLTVLDMTNRLVGMRSKQAYNIGNSSLCASRVQCVGAQKYYAPMNSCVDPECGSYYFHEIRPETRECHMRVSFAVVAIFTLVGFACAEVMLSEAYRRLAHKVVSTFTTTG